MEEVVCPRCGMVIADGERRVSWFSNTAGEVDERGAVHLDCTLASAEWHGPSLEFVSDGPVPVRYGLDEIAGRIVDERASHPEAVVKVYMPARDRAQAVAMLRLALAVLDE